MNRKTLARCLPSCRWSSIPTSAPRLQFRSAALWATIVLMMFWMSADAAQTVHRYEWEVSYFPFSPDCNTTGAKDVLGVHQLLPVEIPLGASFPGPTIRVRERDRVEVKVTNRIQKFNPFGQPPERLSIHWHGIRQRGTPESDGAAGLTECGIPQNQSRVYSFTVDRPGTYFWHGHFGSQRSAGLYGLLIVDQRLGALVPTYDSEFAITLDDWWHKDIYVQADGLDRSINWTWVGSPQSFLIKGDSASPPCQLPFGCPVAELECGTNRLRPDLRGSGTLIWNVLPGKTYLVRMVNAASFAFLNFVIEAHVLTVLEGDGHRLQPFNTTSIDILPGQSYNFQFSTQPGYPSQRVYHVGVSARDRIRDSKVDGGTDPGLAVLSYNLPYNQTRIIASPTKASTLWEAKPAIAVGGPRWNDTSFGPYFQSQLRALIGYSYPVPRVSHRNISLVIGQIKVMDSDSNSKIFRMRWALNNISYDTSHGNTSLLAQLAGKRYVSPIPRLVDMESLSKNDVYENRTYNMKPDAIQGGYYQLKHGEVVTVILQNTAMYNTTASEAHPWHLHGHDVFTVGFGSGLFDPKTSPQGFNLDDPPVRNTVPVLGLGWVAVRFIADNPGIWSFHCHNEIHNRLGLMVVFAYGLDDINPKQVPQCQ